MKIDRLPPFLKQRLWFNIPSLLMRKICTPPLLFENSALPSLSLPLYKEEGRVFQRLIQYYSSFAVTADFCLVGPTEKHVLKIMWDIKSSEAGGKLSGKFLKDDADFLVKLVCTICNLSISRGVPAKSRN